MPTYATIHTKLLRQFSSTGDDDIPELNNFLPDYRCANCMRDTQSIYAVQIHLGHKSPKMSQRYARFLDEDKKRIAHSAFD